MGGNNYVVSEQLLLDEKAKLAGITVIPDCGLAPGIPSILTAHAFNSFDVVNSVTIRVGGIPGLKFKNSNDLGYATVFSVAGLINEYVENALILYDYEEEYVKGLSGKEDIYFGKYGKMEAAYTSGGTSTLTKTYAGRIRNLDYKTIRYPGHFKWFRTLDNLGLLEKGTFRDELEKALPNALGKLPDVVLFRMNVFGTINSKEIVRTYEFELECNSELTAMAQATGFSASTVALMIGRGEIIEKGVVPQELCVAPQVFINQMRLKGIDIKITEK